MASREGAKLFLPATPLAQHPGPQPPWNSQVRLISHLLHSTLPTESGESPENVGFLLDCLLEKVSEQQLKGGDSFIIRKKIRIILSNL